MEWILLITVVSFLFAVLTAPAQKPVKPPASWDDIQEKLDALDRQIAVTKGRIESLRKQKENRFDQMV